jgi:predicted lysophospholipase L1 biosynthesis ABC-type transport system permease subunit
VAIVNRTLADWLVRRDGAAPAPALTEGNVTSAAGDGFASLLGRRIATGLDAGEGEFVTVVGVVEDLPQASPDAAIAPEIYRPWAQATRWGVDTFRVVARGPMPSERALHDAVARVSPRLALDELRPLEVAARAVVAKPRIVGRLLSAFAGISLLLAAIGVHGLVALQVAERRRELGVRLALGARPWDLLRRAMVWGAKPGVWGLVAGAVAGAAAWPLFERLLGGLGRSPSAGGPWAPAFAAAVALAVATLVACLGPALRAARTEPVDVLRGE